MWANMLLGILALMLTATVNASVTELTSSNFESLVKNSNSVWVVEFYSPTCPYCQDFAPEYEQVGRMLENSNIKVGRVNGVHDGGLSEKYSIHGYPTVKLFKPNTAAPIDYNGPRTASTIVDSAKALSLDKHIRSFGDAYMNLPQTRRLPTSGGSSLSESNDDVN